MRPPLDNGNKPPHEGDLYFVKVECQVPPFLSGAPSSKIGLLSRARSFRRVFEKCGAVRS